MDRKILSWDYVRPTFLSPIESELHIHSNLNSNLSFKFEFEMIGCVLMV